MKADESLLKFEEVLEELIRPLGLHKLQITDTIQNALLSEEEDRVMWTAEECFNKAITLSQYCIIVQQEINKNAIKRKWAESNMKVLFGRYCKEYGDQFTRFEERIGMAISDQSSLQKLERIRLTADAKVEQLSFILSNIRDVVDNLKEMGKTKRNKQYVGT